MGGWARLRRHARRLWDGAPAVDPSRITAGDIDACYRLLLGRAPDADGVRTYEPMIGHVDVADLVSFFVGSPEFKGGRHYRTIVGDDAASRSVRVDLGTHVIPVHENDPTSGGTLRQTGGYEPHLAARLSRALTPGATFVDVGASVGFFTLLAARLVGPTGRVFAVEPSPRNCKLLSLSLLENGMTNVVTFPTAASDVEELLLYDAVGSNGFVSPMPTDLEGARAMGLRTIVRSIVLDRALGDLPRLDVLKIDVEGAEHRALSGARGLLETHRPLVFSEFGPKGLRDVSGVEPEDYLRFLVGMGYELAVLREDGAVVRCGTQCGAILDAQDRRGSDHIDMVAFDPTRHLDALA